MLISIVICIRNYIQYKESDLDNQWILSGETFVRELVSLNNPGVTKNLKSITVKLISVLNIYNVYNMVTPQP